VTNITGQAMRHQPRQLGHPVGKVL